MTGPCGITLRSSSVESVVFSTILLKFESVLNCSGRDVDLDFGSSRSMVTSVLFSAKIRIQHITDKTFGTKLLHSIIKDKGDFDLFSKN